MIDRNQIEKGGKYIGQKCPVCNGWGTVSFKKLTCHACLGKGYILIPAKIDTKKEYGEQT